MKKRHTTKWRTIDNMKLRVDSFIYVLIVSTSILTKYQHLFYICTYFCAHPTFMMPARGNPRHDVNTLPTQWRDVACACDASEHERQHPPRPSDVTKHVHETQVNMNVNTFPNPVTWRRMCMWRKLTWTVTPSPTQRRDVACACDAS